MANNAIALIKHPSVKDRFSETLNDATKGASFVTSLINIVNGNEQLKKCDPNTIIGAALTAASLKIPINASLGFAALVPFGQNCQFQLMVKGLVQLAIRSGKYKTIHVTEVYEDELKFYDPVIDEILFTNVEDRKQRDSGEEDKIIGYYAKLVMVSGYEKHIYMTKKAVEAHGKKYSKTFSYNSSLWKKDFDAMAKKTVLKQLLSRWAELSPDLEKAIESDQGTIKDDKITYDDNPNSKDNNIPEVEILDLSEDDVINE